jgi:hypothetical protein
MDDDDDGTVVHLPPLTPNDAVRLVAILESITGAIWGTYGERMGKLLMGDPNHRPDAPHPPLDDSDLPF